MLRSGLHLPSSRDRAIGYIPVNIKYTVVAQRLYDDDDDDDSEVA